MAADLEDRIAAVVAGLDLGTGSARKGGRNPKFPYVPVVKLPEAYRPATTKQIMGLAFATREAAVEAAEKHLARERAHLARKMGLVQYRALREHYGLPRELEV